ncbi:MAG: DUF2971 domain-containing protein [Candidatus Cyclonatronum sp.]|uniref:DUF2971 domain-containing protein n=1 Tax=Cyclonatronum sp. TaxID=3024185 RepID=UPI0025BF4150|nr:DUF2971 domain-containing protein [Cyclonatronum sp.]MCH8487211.1 DUF2971 domain-containing protein [Cyclonatronum sp.]
MEIDRNNYLKEWMPDKIYKYKSFDKASTGCGHVECRMANPEKPIYRRILEDNQIYFSSAKNFNDPFDCTLVPRYDLGTREQKKSMLVKYGRINFPDKSDLELDAIAEAKLNSGELDDQLEIRSKREYWVEKTYNDIGIFSATTCKKNPLMWAHYAASHSGFCVEYDSLKLQLVLEQLYINKRLVCNHHKIKYVSLAPHINPYLNPESPKIVLDMLLHKHILWSYEEEIRYLLLGHPGFVLQCPDNVISTVYLGRNISEENEGEVIRLIQKKSVRPDLFKAKLQPNSFEIEFDQIL